MSLSNFERYQRIAWAYDLLDLPFEYGRYRKIRPLLFRGLSGRILEAGVGTGRNFPFYPPGSEVVGIDLSPAMLARAERAVPLEATFSGLKPCGAGARLSPCRRRLTPSNLAASAAPPDSAQA